MQFMPDVYDNGKSVKYGARKSDKKKDSKVTSIRLVEPGEDADSDDKS